MIGGVTRQMLPRLPMVPHLHVNRPLLVLFLPGRVCYCYQLLFQPFHSPVTIKAAANFAE